MEVEQENAVIFLLSCGSEGRVQRRCLCLQGGLKRLRLLQKGGAILKCLLGEDFHNVGPKGCGVSIINTGAGLSGGDNDRCAGFKKRTGIDKLLHCFQVSAAAVRLNTHGS